MYGVREAKVDVHIYVTTRIYTKFEMLVIISSFTASSKSCVEDWKNFASLEASGGGVEGVSKIMENVKNLPLERYVKRKTLSPRVFERSWPKKGVAVISILCWCYNRQSSLTYSPPATKSLRWCHNISDPAWQISDFQVNLPPSSLFCDTKHEKLAGNAKKSTPLTENYVNFLDFFSHIWCRVEGRGRIQLPNMFHVNFGLNSSRQDRFPPYLEKNIVHLLCRITHLGPPCIWRSVNSKPPSANLSFKSKYWQVVTCRSMLAKNYLWQIITKIPTISLKFIKIKSNSIDRSSFWPSSRRRTSSKGQ